MTIDELNAKLKEQKDKLATCGGMVRFGPSGPVGISIIESLVAVADRQQREIDELKARLDALPPIQN